MKTSMIKKPSERIADILSEDYMQSPMHVLARFLDEYAAETRTALIEAVEKSRYADDDSRVEADRLIHELKKRL